MDDTAQPSDQTAPKPTRGGGVIGGAVKGKMSGKGAGAGAMSAAQGSASEELADVADIAQAAITGAAKGGVGGAVAGAVITGLKSKTGRKAILTLLIAVPVLIAVVFASMFSGGDGTQNVSMAAAMHAATAESTVSKVITDPAVTSILQSAATNGQVPYQALAAVYQAQSVNKTRTGPFGIDLTAASSGADGISQTDAEDLSKAARFVANRLRLALQTTMEGTDSTSLTAGMVDGTDSSGNNRLVPDTSAAGEAALVASKIAWVNAFKMLPLTGISDSADSIYSMVTAWGAGNVCQPNPDNVTGTPTTPQASAGLDASQSAYAATIVQKSVDMNLPKQAAVIAIMTTMAESSLHMYWNPKVPGSELLANGGPKGVDGFSVGLFQQQVHGSSYSWGTADQAMDPAYSAGSFFKRLLGVPNWAGLDLGTAAQTVQVSAFPAAYSKWQTMAQTIVDADLAASGSGSDSLGKPAPDPSGSAAASTTAACNPATVGSSTAGAGIPGSTGVDPTGTYIRPIVGGTVTQFGWRFHPIHLRWMIHYGNDFPMPAGTPIYATAAGTVTYSGYLGDFGNHIRIEHAGGVGSSYSHIVDGGLLVHVGDHVTQGQMIAKVGSTGGSTGPHLHYEMYVGGKTVDALAYMATRTIRLDSDCGPPPPANAPHN